MGSELVSLITLEVNGQSITDFKSVTEKEVELRKQVNLMNDTKFIKTTPRYGVQVEYAIPKEGEVDFTEVEDGTLTVDLQNGKRITFTGVSTLKIGDAKMDGENEVTRNIDFGASGRIEA